MNKIVHAGDRNTTHLITHVISGKQPKVGLNSMFCIATLKVVEFSTVCEGIVAVLHSKSKYVDVIRSAGTCCSIWEEESCTTTKEDINSWPEWCSTDKMFCDDRLIITVIHV